MKIQIPKVRAESRWGRLELWFERRLPRLWRRHPFQAALLFGAFASQLYFTLAALLLRLNWADTSLWGCRYGPCPGYFAALGTINPEGTLWQVQNPLPLGEQGYILYVFLFYWSSVALQLRAARIPLRVVCTNAVLSMFFWSGYGHELQNLTIAAWVPWGYLWWPLLAVPVLMKLPVGPWPFWSPLEPHVYCALHCGGNYLDPANLAAHVSNWACLAVMWLLPVMYRRIDKAQKRTKDGKTDALISAAGVNVL